jgi:serine protease
MRTVRRRLLAAACVALLAAPAAHAAGGDPRIGEQYSLGQLHAPQAWALSQGRGVVVAVVDSGVDLGHPDLRGRLVPGATFLGCGPKSCGNGDWRSGPADRRGDAYGHGTAVAGAVVAGRGNGVGIVGIAPLAKVMPVKIGDKLGYPDDDIAYGIRWATNHGADVINLSISLHEEPVTSAVQYAIAHGVVVVAAAGNDSVPLCNTAPAGLADVLCVTATDRNEAPAGYSSGAVKQSLLSVAAPGGAGTPVSPVALPVGVPYPDCPERILSLWPRGDSGAGRCLGEGGYRYLSGTSLAAPHVAGVVALLLARGMKPAHAVDVLVATARTPGAGPGLWTPQYGHGIVDAYAALTHA